MRGVLLRLKEGEEARRFSLDSRIMVWRTEVFVLLGMYLFVKHQLLQRNAPKSSKMQRHSDTVLYE